MIVEQTTRVDSESEADDILAGWTRLPTFKFAYLRLPVAEGAMLTLVGLFGCKDGELARGQRKVIRVRNRGGRVR